MKKYLLIFTAILSTLFLLTGCTSKGKDDPNHYLNAIKERGTLIIATSPDYPPFEFQVLKDNRNEIVGADIKLAQAIADELGVKLVIQSMNFNSILTSLAAGKVDMAISGLSTTPERKASFDFTIPYYNAENKMLILKSNAGTFNTKESFTGKSVGAQKGSAQLDAITAQLPNSHAVGIASIGNLVSELTQGKIQGLMIESTVGQAYIDANPSLVWSDAKFETGDEGAFAIALPQHSGNLKVKINSIIKDLQESGKMDQFVTDAFKMAVKAGQID
ncbi:MAG: transporter substrate-binding domain-containing protein [Streptococcaceae bacterium]|jgi:polar amino acid transport system substrate-binding protein|nr:transporter substrate-binding domain-containing protein [Streptococcaceae bacterium]